MSHSHTDSELPDRLFRLSTVDVNCSAYPISNKEAWNDMRRLETINLICQHEMSHL
jgi:hypothetical protein